MSKIEVDQVDPQSGTTLTLGTSGDTVSIPSGVTLANAGTATGFASIAWQSSIVTAATITVVAGRGYWLDTSSNAITVTLPASASVGDQIILTDYARNWGTNAVTINTNSLKFQGNATPNPVYNTNGQSVDIVYSGTTKGWIPNSDDDVTLETPQTVSAEYLVVAGGGSGGRGGGGGGAGAGGFRTNYSSSTISLSIGQTYTCTVGAGGAAIAAGGTNTDGNSGNNSVLSGSGITTITSAGGGAGAAYGNPGINGGSGGGAGNNASGGGLNGGSGNTPSVSPSQGNDGGDTTGINAGAGGGGAAAVGSDGSGSGSTGTAGNGGNGTANSITGSSVTYAGGGGGGTDGRYTVTAGTGGLGGGGNGGHNGNPTDGTANIGGGGGGGSVFASPFSRTVTGAGGSGVVILRVPTADYSSTTTGSPTVTTDGSDTIIKFTGDGSYTA